MEPLYQCMAKATAAEGDQMKYGPNWIFAKRARLKIFDDHLECGNWRINNSEIKEAVLYSIYSTFVIPGYVLRIRTPEKTYHFGVNWGSFWKGDLPFNVLRIKGKLGYSLTSVILRLVILGYLAYFIWKTFLRQ